MGQYDLTLGTLLMGIIFNTYLFGLVTFQFTSYWGSKFKDPLPIKIMVIFLFILDCVHSIAVIWMAWAYCVTNFTNPAILGLALWPYTFTPIATALASIVTQTFLGWRIYRLSNSRILYAVIIIFAVPACIIGMICGIKAWIIEVSVKLVVLQSLVTAWLVLQLSVDVFTACTLGFLLWRAKTGFSKTDTVLNRLIRGAIQTGFFAAIFAAGDLITFLRVPTTNFYGMFAIPIGRIYTNTLLDTLLTRTEMRQKLNGAIDMDSARQAPSMLQWAPATVGSTTRQDSTSIPLSEISTQKDVVVFDDDGMVSSKDLKGSTDSV